MAKPTVDISWATDDIIDPLSTQNNKVEPANLKKTDGWSYLEKPPFNWFNYWMNGVKQWVDHLDKESDDSKLSLWSAEADDITSAIPGGISPGGVASIRDLTLNTKTNRILLTGAPFQEDTTGDYYVFYSDDDGDTWQASQLVGENGFFKVVYWPKIEKFVGVGINEDHKIFTSDDGITWTEVYADVNGDMVFTSIAVSDDFCLVGGTDFPVGKIVKSGDGATWTDSTPAGGFGIIERSLAYGNGRWYFMDELSVYISEDDGSTWSDFLTGLQFSSLTGFFHNGRYFSADVDVVSGDSFTVSTSDGTDIQTDVLTMDVAGGYDFRDPYSLFCGGGYIGNFGVLGSNIAIQFTRDLTNMARVKWPTKTDQSLFPDYVGFLSHKGRFIFAAYTSIIAGADNVTIYKTTRRAN